MRKGAAERFRGAVPSAEMPSFDLETLVPAPSASVWRRVTAPAGINDELRPFLRMTVPRPMRGRTIADVTPGLRLGRSWLLIFGVVPFEYDDITIAEVELGRRFLERSSMLSMRLWQHERLITAAGGSCQVRDQITFEFRRPLARAPWLEACLQTWLERLFRHRHKRLVQHFRELDWTSGAA